MKKDRKKEEKRKIERREKKNDIICDYFYFIVCQDAADCSMQAMCHDRHAHYHCVDRRCLCLKDEHIDEGDKIPHGPGGHGPGP